MADRKFILGTVYFDHRDDNEDVEIEYSEEEGAPQIHLKIPISIGAGDTEVQMVPMCIWVNEDALDDLQGIVDELRSSYKAQ